MKIKKTNLKDVFLISPNKIKDSRGYFQEIYNLKKLDLLKLKKFVQENLGNLVKDTDLSKFIL